MMGSHEDQGAQLAHEEVSDEDLLASMDANRFWKEGQRRAGDGMSYPTILQEMPFQLY